MRQKIALTICCACNVTTGHKWVNPTTVRSKSHAYFKYMNYCSKYAGLRKRNTSLVSRELYGWFKIAYTLWPWSVLLVFYHIAKIDYFHPFIFITLAFGNDAIVEGHTRSPAPRVRALRMRLGTSGSRTVPCNRRSAWGIRDTQERYSRFARKLIRDRCGPSRLRAGLNRNPRTSCDCCFLARHK